MTCCRRGVLFLLIGHLLCSGGFAQYNDPYEPDWDHLDQRPNPAWYDDAKFGLLISWGVYSVPAFAPTDSLAPGPAEAAWYAYHLGVDVPASVAVRDVHRRTFPRNPQYTELARDFRAESFDPAAWGDLFRRSGARYVVLTAKHRDGFALWPSPESRNWNSVDIGPGRDLVADVKAATEAAGLRFGVRYALFEWFNPLYAENFERYVDTHLHPQMRDLVLRYRPEVFWADAADTRPSADWKSEAFLAWLYNYSLVRHSVVVNDRWGSDTPLRHGGFFSGALREDRLNFLSYRQRTHKWEDARGITESLGLNRNAALEDYTSSHDLVHHLVDVVSRGGNLVLGIGPTADGRIPVVAQQRLADVGAWLDVNGEAIYGTRPWRAQREGEWVRYTRKGGAVYAILLRWPGTRLVLEEPNLSVWSDARLLGHDGEISWQRDDDRIIFTLPDLTVNDMPAPYATVLRMTVVN